MFKRILVPLDGSKTGETALYYVEDLLDGLAAGERVEVILLQVVKLGTRNVEIRGAKGTIHVPYIEEEMEQVEEKATQYLDKAGEGLRSKGAIVN